MARLTRVPLLLLALAAACTVATEPPPPNERAMTKIAAFANAPTAKAPTAADYADAGVTGVPRPISPPSTRPSRRSRAPTSTPWPNCRPSSTASSPSW